MLVKSHGRSCQGVTRQILLKPSEVHVGRIAQDTVKGRARHHLRGQQGLGRLDVERNRGLGECRIQDRRRSRGVEVFRLAVEEVHEFTAHQAGSNDRAYDVARSRRIFAVDDDVGIVFRRKKSINLRHAILEGHRLVGFAPGIRRNHLLHHVVTELHVVGNFTAEIAAKHRDRLVAHDRCAGEVCRIIQPVTQLVNIAAIQGDVERNSGGMISIGGRPLQNPRHDINGRGDGHRRAILATDHGELTADARVGHDDVIDAERLFGKSKIAVRAVGNIASRHARVERINRHGAVSADDDCQIRMNDIRVLDRRRIRQLDGSHLPRLHREVGAESDGSTGYRARNAGRRRNRFPRNEQFQQLRNGYARHFAIAGKCNAKVQPRGIPVQIVVQDLHDVRIGRAHCRAGDAAHLHGDRLIRLRNMVVDDVERDLRGCIRRINHKAPGYERVIGSIGGSSHNVRYGDRACGGRIQDRRDRHGSAVLRNDLRHNAPADSRRRRSGAQQYDHANAGEQRQRAGNGALTLIQCRFFHTQMRSALSAR